jgi:hypothetical protein
LRGAAYRAEGLAARRQSGILANVSGTPRELTRKPNISNRSHDCKTSSKIRRNKEVNNNCIEKFPGGVAARMILGALAAFALLARQNPVQNHLYPTPEDEGRICSG